MIGAIKAEGAKITVTNTKFQNNTYASIIITSTSQFKGEYDITYIAELNVELEKKIYVYDATEHKPRATVTYGTETLVNGKDYIVTYVDNIDVGTAHAIITGIGKYYGVFDKEFQIIRADRNVNVYNVGLLVGEELILDYTYDGEQAGGSAFG